MIYNPGDTISIYDIQMGITYYGFLSRKIYHTMGLTAEFNIMAYSVLIYKRNGPFPDPPKIDFYIEFEQNISLLAETRLVLTEKTKKNFTYL